MMNFRENCKTTGKLCWHVKRDEIGPW